MLTPRLYLRRAARTLKRGGFTLVELLVVIGIIAILAGVALGPITNGIKKAKQSSGVQTVRGLGLAMFSAANDNSQVYPDGAAGTDATGIAKALLAGGYVNDSGMFFISGDTNGASKYTGATSAATNIAQTNISWDFLGNAGNGVPSASYPFAPLVWSTLTAGTEPIPGASTVNTALTGVANAASPFGTDGTAVFYMGGSAAFVAGVSGTITLVTGPNMASALPTTFTVNLGK